MLKLKNKKAQAAVELAVFGAILIFLLGAIVRSAMSNSYLQNQNFKAMRIAMLASWNGSKAQNTARNNASILFIEDRLSPDFNKYGVLDRNPLIANGSGTFTYMLLYPLTGGPGGDNMQANLPVMDVYINGQHFPFTTASYVTNATITRSTGCSSDCQASTPQQQQCLQNQINRNAREWVGGTVAESLFENIIPVTLSPTAGHQMAVNASTIFTEMVNVGLIKIIPGSADLTQGGSGLVGNVTSLVTSTGFISSYASSFPGLDSSQLDQIQSILQSNMTQYKLFYSMVANGEDVFTETPPVCANPNTLACKDKALSSTLEVPFTTCPPANVDSSTGLCVNTNGDMEYDLLRLGNYAAVDTQFPTAASCSAASMRCNIAWQWSATAGTLQGNTTDGADPMIDLDPDNNQYPSYDIDGRLKTVTIYSLAVNSGIPTVSYEDYQGGDIDSSWDSNSCGPKPGLQSESQIFTFTKKSTTCSDGTACSLGTTCSDGTPCPQGTYLKILEGKLYNPETNQFVRSANRRDTIDLIQRTIQLSNNTGRFCSGNTPLTTVAGDGVTPNPVEVCIPPGAGENCFSSEQNIKSTCFDENDNMLFVRSRLEDRRGHFWMTNASGQLKVQ